MTNHVHLVVQANHNLTAIPQLMKRLAGRQTRFVNTLCLIRFCVCMAEACIHKCYLFRWILWVMGSARLHQSKSRVSPIEKNTIPETRNTMWGNVAHNLRASGKGSVSSP
jgi:REP element-mobilizing transposase RayT